MRKRITILKSAFCNCYSIIIEEFNKIYTTINKLFSNFFKVVKSQGSLEFMTILVFLIFIILGLLSVLQYKMIDLERYQDKQYIDDYMSSVFTELKLLNLVNRGYYREVMIPTPIEKNYDIRIYPDSFVVRNINKNLTYLYYFAYNGTVGIYNKTIKIDGNDYNVTYMYFEKK